MESEENRLKRIVDDLKKKGYNRKQIVNAILEMN